MRRRGAPPGFHPPYPHLFRNFCENFDPMPCEVRSPGQVKWPNCKITFKSRHGYNVSGKFMKLSEYDEVISAYKTYISEFVYRWPHVRSFLRPPHYKSMGKKSTPLYLLWRKPFWVELYRIGQLWTIRVKICIVYPSKGHLRSPEVINRHLPINFDQKEIETWDWCQCVRLGQANRLICNMTHFGYHVTLAWLDLRSNFDLDLSKSFLYMARRALTRKTRWYQIRCSTFKIKDFIVEKPFWKILEFWPLVTSILTWDKKWSKWFRNDFLRAFERCLSFFSTATRSRDHGEAFKRPPPPAGVGKSRGPAWRGLTELKWNILTLKGWTVTWLHEGNVIVEDQLTHNFKRRSRTAPPKAVFYAAVQNVSRSWKWFCSKMPLTLTSRFMETWLVKVIDSIVAVIYIFVYSVVKCVRGAADNT